MNGGVDQVASAGRGRVRGVGAGRRVAAHADRHRGPRRPHAIGDHAAAVVRHPAIKRNALVPVPVRAARTVSLRLQIDGRSRSASWTCRPQTAPSPRRRPRATRPLPWPWRISRSSSSHYGCDLHRTLLCLGWQRPYADATTATSTGPARTSLTTHGRRRRTASTGSASAASATPRT